MCWCRPEVRTPNCGRPGCHPPINKEAATGTVTAFNRAKIDGETVFTLECLLEKAKCGELTSLVYVDAYSDGKIGYGWAGTPNDEMMTKVDRLKYSYLRDTED